MNRKNSKIAWRDFVRSSKKDAIKKWLDKKLTGRYNIGYWKQKAK